jgi:hypothetical protein
VSQIEVRTPAGKRVVVSYDHQMVVAAIAALDSGDPAALDELPVADTFMLKLSGGQQSIGPVPGHALTTPYPLAKSAARGSKELFLVHLVDDNRFLLLAGPTVIDEADYDAAGDMLDYFLKKARSAGS